MNLLLNLSRFLVGLLFIFSGLIKANDPLGLTYKLEEYFSVLNIEWLNPIGLYLAIFICSIEVLVGIALLLLIKMRYTAPLLLAMILFFTLLTGYAAITKKITDCGAI